MPNRLGLAYVARKLQVGTPLTVDAIRKKEVELVILAHDASENTIKKITDKAKYYNIDVNMDFDSKTISQAIGKRNIMVIAILDKGFAKMYKK